MIRASRMVNSFSKSSGMTSSGSASCLHVVPEANLSIMSCSLSASSLRFWLACSQLANSATIRFISSRRPRARVSWPSRLSARNPPKARALLSSKGPLHCGCTDSIFFSESAQSFQRSERSIVRSVEFFSKRSNSSSAALRTSFSRSKKDFNLANSAAPRALPPARTASPLDSQASAASTCRPVIIRSISRRKISCWISSLFHWITPIVAATTIAIAVPTITHFLFWALRKSTSSSSTSRLSLRWMDSGQTAPPGPGMAKNSWRRFRESLRRAAGRRAPSRRRPSKASNSRFTLSSCLLSSSLCWSSSRFFRTH